MSVEKITRILQQGAVSASELKLLLGISQPTLSRWVKRVPHLVRIGETYHSKYALQVEVPGIGSEQGVYMVTEEGILKPVGVIKFLKAGQTAFTPLGYVYDGQYPPLYDMMPEGYMGGAFVRRYGSGLEFPKKLSDWSEAQKLIAIAKRGEDMVGNLVFGRESAERWQQQQTREFRMEDLPILARQASAGYPAGSPVGGGQPKFAVYTGKKHYLVKYIRKENTPTSNRWMELLRCEHTALNILMKFGIPAAHTRITESDEFIFLLSERFDRVGAKGRRPVVSLRAVDKHFYNDPQRWSLTGEKLLVDRRISRPTLEQIKLIEAFSILIGDSDRQFDNLSLIPDLNFSKFTLAPAYDKLPMSFAPRRGDIPTRKFIPPLPENNLIEVWDKAEKMASEFWFHTRYRTFNK